MNPEIIERIQRLQRYAAGLRDVAASVRAHAPGGAEGADPTGAVRLAVGADGLPATIRVEPGWDRRIAPHALGDAVMAAYEDAIAEGMRSWSAALRRTSWSDRVARFEAGQTEHPAAEPPPGAVEAPPDGHELTERILGALYAVRTAGATAPATGVGSGGAGNVSITLTRTRMQSCAVDPSWAARRDGESLTAALTAALRAARTELDGGAARAELDGGAASQPPAGELDRLVRQSLALLETLTRTDPRGRGAR